MLTRASPQHVRQAVEDTLQKLGVEYLDLYLMHVSIARARIHALHLHADPFRSAVERRP